MALLTLLTYIICGAESQECYRVTPTAFMTSAEYKKGKTQNHDGITKKPKRARRKNHGGMTKKPKRARRRTMTA